jgi:hypothetical protein
MAKFTSQEVTALKEGGNQHAKDIYFKGLDQQRQSVPDGRYYSYKSVFLLWRWMCYID